MLDLETKDWIAAEVKAQLKTRPQYVLINSEALTWITSRLDRKHLIKLATIVSTVIALTQNPLNLPGTKPVLPTVVAPILEQVSGASQQ